MYGYIYKHILTRVLHTWAKASKGRKAEKADNTTEQKVFYEEVKEDVGHLAICKGFKPDTSTCNWKKESSRACILEKWKLNHILKVT